MGANPPPGHHPTLMHWCEYASRVTKSARLGIPPGWRGAGWPENRVWARSKLPHQKWTGLVLPTKRLRNTSRTRLIWTSSCRSEEHTSELQSRLHLVCRLLLEKKKKTI